MRRSTWTLTSPGPSWTCCHLVSSHSIFHTSFPTFESRDLSPSRSHWISCTFWHHLLSRALNLKAYGNRSQTSSNKGAILSKGHLCSIYRKQWIWRNSSRLLHSIMLVYQLSHKWKRCRTGFVLRVSAISFRASRVYLLRSCSRKMVVTFSS